MNSDQRDKFAKSLLSTSADKADLMIACITILPLTVVTLMGTQLLL